MGQQNLRKKISKHFFMQMSNNSDKSHYIKKNLMNNRKATCWLMFEKNSNFFLITKPPEVQIIF